VVILLIVVFGFLLEGVLGHSDEVLLVLLKVLRLLVVADQTDIGRDDLAFFEDHNVTDDKLTS